MKKGGGMRITVIGCGYVGLINGAGFAESGHEVICIDTNDSIISTLNRGIVPIYEPGLGELIQKNRQAGKLEFAKTPKRSDICIIAVGTPCSIGEPDLTQLYSAIREIARHETGLVIIRSTVPIGTCRKLRKLVDVPLVMMPEFLREGYAAQDFFCPDRIVIGYEEPHARDMAIGLYGSFSSQLVCCTYETAETIKYANNAFLALKVSYVNQLAILCEAVGADVRSVSRALGMDSRIGSKYLSPGPGYGGSCFPKDIRALVNTGEKHNINMDLIREIENTNERQKEYIVKKLYRLLGDLLNKKICVLGLAFKAGTDDVRESPSLDIVRKLLFCGATVCAHDPKAINNAQRILQDRTNFSEDIYEAMKEADALLIMTEWEEYSRIDGNRAKKAMRGNTIFDTRNILDVNMCPGFVYEGMGYTSKRGAVCGY